jgi:transcription elongation factor GreA
MTKFDRKLISSGSEVVIKTAGQKMKFLLVDSKETDPGKGKISIQSPVGQALLGHKSDDEIIVELGQLRKIFIKILSVE